MHAKWLVLVLVSLVLALVLTGTTLAQDTDSAIISIAGVQDVGERTEAILITVSQPGNLSGYKIQVLETTWNLDGSAVADFTVYTMRTPLGGTGYALNNDTPILSGVEQILLVHRTKVVQAFDIQPEVDASEGVCPLSQLDSAVDPSVKVPVGTPGERSGVTLYCQVDGTWKTTVPQVAGAQQVQPAVQATPVPGVQAVQPQASAVTGEQCGSIEWNAPNMQDGSLYGAAPIGPAGTMILGEAWGPDAMGENIRLVFGIPADTAIWISNIRGGTAWKVCYETEAQLWEDMQRHYATLEQRDGTMTTVMGILPRDIQYFGHFISQTADGFGVPQDLSAFFARWEGASAAQPTPVAVVPQGAAASQPVAVPITVGSTVRATGSALRIRSGAGTNFDILGPMIQTVRVEQVLNGWARYVCPESIVSPTGECWSSTDFLTVVSASMSTPVPQVNSPSQPQPQLPAPSQPTQAPAQPTLVAASAVCPSGGAGQATGPAILEVQHNGAWTVIKLNSGSTYGMSGGGCWTFESQSALDARWPEHSRAYLEKTPGGQALEM